VWFIWAVCRAVQFIEPHLNRNRPDTTQVTDFIGDLHCTIVSKLVQCNDAVEHAKAPANTTTCPEVSTLSVRARGVAKVLTTDPTDPFTRLDVTSAYVNHSVDAFVPLPDGSKPYPEVCKSTWDDSRHCNTTIPCRYS